MNTNHSPCQVAGKGTPTRRTLVFSARALLRELEDESAPEPADACSTAGVRDEVDCAP